MSPKTINIIGLFLNVAGTGIAFYFGFPQPSFDEGLSLGVSDNTKMPDGRSVQEHDQEKRRLRGRYRCMSRIGLTLILLGFIAQLLAAME